LALAHCVARHIVSWSWRQNNSWEKCVFCQVVSWDGGGVTGRF
jgi:hypothetical protein